MIEWVCCELHTHTVNSDGRFTLLELSKQAKEIGLDCIALTDHNTLSGHLEIPFAEKETDIKIVPGMEWTTFYGHMIAMGIKKYVEWRNRVPSDIHKGIDEIHEAGGLAGIAHPYRIGSPMCTGCYWQFNIQDWSKVDYLEVWSENFPSINSVNHRAFNLWTSLLDQGYRLTGVSGRDWHGGGGTDEHIAVTYLGLESDDKDEFNNKVLKALALGHSVSTMGPLMTFTAKVEAQDKKYFVGDKIEEVIKSKVVEFNIDTDFSVRIKYWNLDLKPLKIVLNSNNGYLAEKIIDTKTTNESFMVCLENINWVRAEMYGSISEKACMIAFTNPIYLEKL